MQKQNKFNHILPGSQWRQHLSRVIGQGKPEGDEKDHEVDIGVRLQAFGKCEGFLNVPWQKMRIEFNTLSLIETGKTS